jgi:hypothetical protein
MKITIESTTSIVEIDNAQQRPALQCRVWEGVTERGVKVQVLVTRIAVHKDDDVSQFEEELREMRAPTNNAPAFPLRMILCALLTTLVTVVRNG